MAQKPYICQKIGDTSVCTIFTENRLHLGRKYVYIFEFKLNGSAKEALRQIDDRGYATEFAASGKKIYKIGVNISSETGIVAEWSSIE